MGGKIQHFILVVFVSDWSVNSVYAPLVLFNHKTTRIKCWILPPILLFINKGNNWYLFFVGVWYSTMNTTLFILFLPIMHISGGKCLCCSIMDILLTMVISSRLIMWFIQLPTIIIGGAWCFVIIPIMFWFNLTRAVCVLWYMDCVSWIIMRWRGSSNPYYNLRQRLLQS